MNPAGGLTSGCAGTPSAIYFSSHAGACGRLCCHGGVGVAGAHAAAIPARGAPAHTKASHGAGPRRPPARRGLGGWKGQLWLPGQSVRHNREGNKRAAQPLVEGAAAHVRGPLRTNYPTPSRRSGQKTVVVGVVRHAPSQMVVVMHMLPGTLTPWRDGMAVVFKVVRVVCVGTRVHQPDAPPGGVRQQARAAACSRHGDKHSKVLGFAQENGQGIHCERAQIGQHGFDSTHLTAELLGRAILNKLQLAEAKPIQPHS
mmetsp:Transcript_28753/g.72336  ORF Transcript_28753/g.72336 Transcript_28753/m.72336 type:complete len:257 (+) Transcript_28753:474-1244(+)